MAAVASTAPAVGLWAFLCLALVLIYKIVVVVLVRTSKTDMILRDRWTGLWIRRGRKDSESSPAASRRTLRSVDEPGPEPHQESDRGQVAG